MQVQSLILVKSKLNRELECATLLTMENKDLLSAKSFGLKSKFSVRSFIYKKKWLKEIKNAGIIDCSAQSDIVDGSQNVSDVFAKQFFEAIDAIRFKKNFPDFFSIHYHITRHNVTNLDKEVVQEVIKVLVDQTLLKNTPIKDGNSYYIIPQD